jgi:hypothetical protein
MYRESQHENGVEMEFSQKRLYNLLYIISSGQILDNLIQKVQDQ